MKHLTHILLLLCMGCTSGLSKVQPSSISNKTKQIDIIAENTAVTFPQTKPNMDSIKAITPQINNDEQVYLKQIEKLQKQVKDLSDQNKELQFTNNQYIKWFQIGISFAVGLAYLVFGLKTGNISNSITGGAMCLFSVVLGQYYEAIAKYTLIVVVLFVIVGLIMYWETRKKKENE